MRVVHGNCLIEQQVAVGLHDVRLGVGDDADLHTLRERAGRGILVVERLLERDNVLLGVHQRPADVDRVDALHAVEGRERLRHRRPDGAR